MLTREIKFETPDASSLFLHEVYAHDHGDFPVGDTVMQLAELSKAIKDLNHLEKKEKTNP